MQLDLLEIGKIVRAHGIKGAVKIIPYLDEDFSMFKHIFVGERRVSANIKKVLPLNDAYSIMLDIIPDVDTAEKYKNQSIYIDRTEYTALSNKIYLSDLIGKDVLDEQGDKVGELIDYSNYGASDILDIKCGVVTYSLPYIAEVIHFDETKDAFIVDGQKFKDLRV